MAIRKKKEQKSDKGRFNKGDEKSSGGKLRPTPKRGYIDNELYLHYKVLEVGVLGHILQSLEDIKKEITLEIEKYHAVRTLKEQPRLYILNMHTGQSITFSIGGTTVTIDPSKKFVIPAIVIGMLLASFKIYNELEAASAQTEQIKLQNEEKKIDIDSKRIDLERKKAIWEQEKDSAAGKLTLYLEENQDILEVRLNETFVK